MAAPVVEEKAGGRAAAPGPKADGGGGDAVTSVLLRAARRGAEVEAEVLRAGEADELPVVGEGPAVASSRLVQHDAPGLVHAERVLDSTRSWVERRQGGRCR